MCEGVTSRNWSTSFNLTLIAVMTEIGSNVAPSLRNRSRQDSSPSPHRQPSQRDVVISQGGRLKRRSMKPWHLPIVGGCRSRSSSYGAAAASRGRPRLPAGWYVRNCARRDRRELKRSGGPECRGRADAGTPRLRSCFSLFPRLHQGRQSRRRNVTGTLAAAAGLEHPSYPALRCLRGVVFTDKISWHTRGPNVGQTIGSSMTRPTCVKGC
jgi:hypothetical protein